MRNEDDLVTVFNAISVDDLAKRSEITLCLYGNSIGNNCFGEEQC